jgi:hypothetical protein
MHSKYETHRYKAQIEAIDHLRAAVETWGPLVTTDDEIHGSEAVEWLGFFIKDAIAILAKIDAPIVPPQQPDLLAETGADS